MDLLFAIQRVTTDQQKPGGNSTRRILLPSLQSRAAPGEKSTFHILITQLLTEGIILFIHVLVWNGGQF